MATRSCIQQFQARVQNEVQSEQQRDGRTLSQDDTRRIENSVFDQMVSDVLLADEYRRRGIVVTDDEVREFARYAPPPWITSAPELQTEGRFDPDKYAAPPRQPAGAAGRTAGLARELLSDARFRAKSCSIRSRPASTSPTPSSGAPGATSTTARRSATSRSLPTTDPAAAKAISDADLRTYFDQHKADFQGPGRAVLSVVTIPRTVTAADSAAARAKARGASRGDREGRQVRGRRQAGVGGHGVGPQRRRPGQGRQGPLRRRSSKRRRTRSRSASCRSRCSRRSATTSSVSTSKKGDTLALRHILIRIQASDSAIDAHRQGRPTRCRAWPAQAIRARSSTRRREKLGLKICAGAGVRGRAGQR